jgi:hypothetical protein
MNDNLKLKFVCVQCGKEFLRSKRNSYNSLKLKCKSFCSRKCQNQYLTTKIVTTCGNCGKEIIKTQYQSKQSKSKQSFCSRSCSVTYHNTHKTTGYRRSKLELYIEQQLTALYPQLTILYNDKTTINSELDIYIPIFKLAFELNGIFHYEPIFGSNVLDKTQNNDNRKFQACIENQISLCVIDSSKQKHFTEKSSQQYLDIITSIINQKLAVET